MLGRFGNSNKQEQHLHVMVRDIDNVLYEGDVYAISSINKRGPFDILPFHNNFIALVQEKITIHVDKKQQLEFHIETGILRQVRNKVEVFIGVEHVASQIDAPSEEEHADK